ncbi:MAG: class I SAM-dependent methyltransferase [Phycisphaerae bacterium]|nr:class I SAM-dependent methyltransferase [Phycisphaerae bacterium]
MANQSITTFMASPACYDGMIQWGPRLEREIPVLQTIFGPAAGVSLLDAGCGTGRHAVAMAERGYRITGADADAPMLTLARRHARERRASVRFVQATYAQLARRARGSFDGVYCLGNALAAAGSERGVRTALANFRRVLRPGGCLMFQVINFAEVRRALAKGAYVRGPQSAVIDGREHVWLKLFATEGEAIRVQSIMLCKHVGRWVRHIDQGRLWPIEVAPVSQWLHDAGFHSIHRWGSYAGEPFRSRTSGDLIVIAKRGEK